MDSVFNFISDLIEKTGLEGKSTDLLTFVITLFALFLICWLFYQLFNKIIHVVIRSWFKRIKYDKGEIFFKKKVIQAISLFVAGILFENLFPFFFNVEDETIQLIKKTINVFIIIVILMVISRVLHSVEFLASRDKKYEQKPINSYTQILLILAYLLCGVLIFSVLFGKSPMTIITAFGAGMAIILLIFQDIILGLVASIQISVNDMIRVGDWIVVPGYNADGIVEEINLTSVKVRNWDNYLSNVPTYTLVKNGFQNVRERDDLEIRRFNQHLLIDIRTIKTVEDSFIEKLREKGLFDGEIQDLKWEAEEKYDFNKVTSITNLGLLRKYIEAYLDRHPGIDNGVMVVRHLQPEGKGQPLEIYAFVKSVSFKPLNYIMADVFEHLYSVIQDFDLEMYQIPAGDDFRGLNSLENKSSTSD